MVLVGALLHHEGCDDHEVQQRFSDIGNKQSAQFMKFEFNQLRAKRSQKFPCFLLHESEVAFPVILFAIDREVTLPMKRGKFMVNMLNCKGVSRVNKMYFGDPGLFDTGFSRRNYRSRFITPVNADFVIRACFTVISDFLNSSVKTRSAGLLECLHSDSND